MKKFIIFGLFFIVSTSPLAADEVPPTAPVFKAEEITAKIREKLSPLVQSALQKHCGEDCPSFKIDVQYKKSLTQDVLEDLGFSHTEVEPSHPELQSVTIAVLIQDKVPQTSKDTLKQI